MNDVKTRPLKPSLPAPPNPKKTIYLSRRLLLMGIVLTFILVAALKVSDYLEWDDDGKPKLTKKRQKKRDKAIQELNDAEQYALKVTIPGYYPCFSCDSTHIYLNIGDVWKYGSTIKKQTGRYPNSRLPEGMRYVVEFKGTLFECKRMELLKIYDYPLLPENLKRAKPLIRPPGNKIDQ